MLYHHLNVLSRDVPTVVGSGPDHHSDKRITTTNSMTSSKILIVLLATLQNVVFTRNPTTINIRSFRDLNPFV